MTSHFHLPPIDPVLIHLWGPFQIRWYSLLYVGGFILGRFIVLKLAEEERFKLTKQDAEDLPVVMLIGAVIGARLFYCLFYDLPSFLENPLYFFKVYNGGLSFHGGVAGIAVGTWYLSYKRKIPFWNLGDAVAVAGTPGLAMGRLGNFINSELWGRVSDVPWALVFPNGGPLPRHPSQLYEGLLEGVILFVLLWKLRHRLHRDGQLAVLFLVGYATMRFIVEFFREPDAQLGYLSLGLTMGQWLCIAMFVAGLVINWVLSTRAAVVSTHGKQNERRPKKTALRR